MSRYRFTWFTTLTFRDSPRTYTAINRAKQFLRAIEREERLKIGYYIAMELTKLGVPHFHLLMGNLEKVRYSKWFTWWFTRYGGARFKMYDPEKGAAYYLVKYTVGNNYQRGWFDIHNLHLLKEARIEVV